MKKILAIILAILSMTLTFSVPIYAEECTKEQLKNGCVNTAIIGGGCKCDENGSSISDILELIIDIMTIGIGILGVIGISIVGVQYLTAGGNEEKTRKAKRRMFEIVIGLVAYVVLFALVKWLMPS